MQIRTLLKSTLVVLLVAAQNGCDTPVNSVVDEDAVASRSDGGKDLALEKRDAKSQKAEKVDICHRTGNGAFIKIRVSSSAMDRHLRHGDGRPLYPLAPYFLTPDEYFELDASCQPVVGCPCFWRPLLLEEPGIEQAWYWNESPVYNEGTTSLSLPGRLDHYNASSFQDPRVPFFGVCWGGYPISQLSQEQTVACREHILDVAKEHSLPCELRDPLGQSPPSPCPYPGF